MGRPRASNDPSTRTELTERQREVLRLIAQGRTNGQIADELGLSLDGAKWHVREILARLGVDSREEAAEWWKHNRGMRERMPGWLGWPLAAGLGGVTAVTGAVVIAASVLLGGSDDRSGPDDARDQLGQELEEHQFLEQPELALVGEGDGWSVYADEEGGVPHAEDAVLPIEASAPSSNRVLVLESATGRVAMMIETRPGPMALLRVSSNELIVSDSLRPSSGGTDPTHRVFVFDLDAPGGPLRHGYLIDRVEYRSPGDADHFVTLSSNERFLYWRQYGSGHGGPIRALDLDTMTDSEGRFEVPGCMSPETMRSVSGLIVQAWPGRRPAPHTV